MSPSDSSSFMRADRRRSEIPSTSDWYSEKRRAPRAPASRMAAFHFRPSLSRRAEEFALLRVRSWSRADVSRLTLMDTPMGGAIGSLVGSVLGATAGVALVMSLTESSVSITVTFAALEVPAAVVVVTGFCVTVSMLSARRVLREDPFITVMARDR